MKSISYPLLTGHSVLASYSVNTIINHIYSAIQMDIYDVLSCTHHAETDAQEMLSTNLKQSGIESMMSNNNISYDKNFKLQILRQELLDISPYKWAGALWIAGAVIFISFHGIQYIRFIKMVNRWSQEVVDQQILDIMINLKASLGISKQLELRFCSCIASPMLVGFINPMILLPSINYMELDGKRQ